MNIEITGNNPLKENFEKAAKFFELSAEAKTTAWASARQDATHAAECYAAIVRSFPAKSAEVVVIPTTLPAMRIYVPGRGMGRTVSL